MRVWGKSVSGGKPLSRGLSNKQKEEVRAANGRKSLNKGRGGFVVVCHCFGLFLIGRRPQTDFQQRKGQRERKRMEYRSLPKKSKGIDH